jgi:L-ribulokinase
MQILANALGMPIKVAKAEQACAFGAAMFAAVAAGIYPKVEDAQNAMGQGFASIYQPDETAHSQYMKLYRKYLEIGEYTER